MSDERTWWRVQRVGRFSWSVTVGQGLVCCTWFTYGRDRAIRKAKRKCASEQRRLDWKAERIEGHCCSDDGSAA